MNARNPIVHRGVRSLYDARWVGQAVRYGVFLSSCDEGSSASAHREMTAIAGVQREPSQIYQLALADFGLAHAGGRLTDALRGVERVIAAAAFVHPLAVHVSHVLRFLLAREFGTDCLPATLGDPGSNDSIRALPLEQFGLSARETVPSDEAVRSAFEELMSHATALGYMLLSHSLMQQSDRARAREEFEGVAVHDFEDVPRDGQWPIVMALAAEVAVYLGDRRRAEALHVLLEPHAERCALHFDHYYHLGSISHFLGILSGAIGREDRAAEYLEVALEQNSRMGADAHATRTRLALGRALASRGSEAAARVLREEALGQARQLGMTPLLD